MADKKSASSSKVTTRVVASSDVAKKPAKKQKAQTEKATKTASKAKSTPKVKKQRDNYFIGAWRELKQVRWPDRKATWSLTFAVVAYSIFFFLLVIALDAVFKYLFDFLVKG